MLQSLREEREGKVQMLLSLRKNGQTSLFEEVRVRTRSTTTRDRTLQFRGAVSTGDSPLDFLLFLQVLCVI